MNWSTIVKQVTPYLVNIETPKGMGTGFLCFYSKDKTTCGIATAAHVIESAEKWEQPIRVQHHESGEEVLLKTDEERFIFLDPKTDTALIIFGTKLLPFPDVLLSLRSIDKPVEVGSEIGWIGFPGIAFPTLCFFKGTVSAKLIEEKAYYIDGVAINGVSGGPVLFASKPERVQIIGLITAYWGNRQGKDLLPGLSVAQDISYLHEVIEDIKDR